MTDPDIAGKLDSVTLPPSYSWGEWSGEYRAIMKGDRHICRVGGVLAKVTPKESTRGLVYREIMRGEWECGQVDALLAWTAQ